MVDYELLHLSLHSFAVAAVFVVVVAAADDAAFVPFFAVVPDRPASSD